MNQTTEYHFLEDCNTDTDRNKYIKFYFQINSFGISFSGYVIIIKGLQDMLCSDAIEHSFSVLRSTYCSVNESEDAMWKPLITWV